MKKTLSKEEYRKILSKLPIVKPTSEDMATVCPHLTMEQAVAAFGKDSGYVACPPLRVKGAFQIVSYHKEYDGNTSRLDWSFTCRTIQSYADLQVHGDIFGEYQYMTEAMKFAEDNWGDELVLDTWDSVLELYIQDPSDLISIGNRSNQPKTKAILYIALNRDLNEIINDHSRPESQLFDDAIVEMTIDDMVWHELKGGRGGYTDFNCAYCGSGLGLVGCSGCGHKFEDDNMRCGWSTPLSKKMVEFLQQNGHVFKKDPKFAWDIEIERHEKYKKAVTDRNAEQELMEKLMEKAKGLYPNGLCPDCFTVIPDDDRVGDACKNCGHFWSTEAIQTF